MKPDNIYGTLVGISPDLDSQDAWKIWRYIQDLLEDERNETLANMDPRDILVKQKQLALNALEMAMAHITEVYIGKALPSLMVSKEVSKIIKQIEELEP